LVKLLRRHQVAQVVVVSFDPVGFEASNLVVDEFFGNAAAVGKGGHAGDGGGQFEACKATAVS
jgi:hypothetical protein